MGKISSAILCNFLPIGKSIRVTSLLMHVRGTMYQRPIMPYIGRISIDISNPHTAVFSLTPRASEEAQALDGKDHQEAPRMMTQSHWSNTGKLRP